mmetsp:Transcript_2436/g.8021  ORF Transcript_2436/g.8021 Transcript_2436/m.8021 type:complete len:233 (-) Transcript_2436:203-901(-)
MMTNGLHSQFAGQRCRWSTIVLHGLAPPSAYSTIKLHMNALCVTTMMWSSSCFMHQSRNSRALARSTGSGSRFSCPGFQNTSVSFSINEKSTPGYSFLYSVTDRRRSHGFPPICSRHDSSATNFAPPHNAVFKRNVGRAHVFIATASVPRMSTSPPRASPSSTPNIAAAVSIARLNGDTTTSSHLRTSASYASPRFKFALNASHCLHPFSVNRASAYASFPYSFGSLSPASL